MDFLTFEDVVSYMDRGYGSVSKPLPKNVHDHRLDRMLIIMEKLGNPQDSFKSIHVAGSKGKGSTSSYMASALTALGYKTGLYMSPHVSDYRERFTIDGKFVDDANLIFVGNLLKNKLDGLTFPMELGEPEPTTFELYTAFAFALFSHMGCSWAVVETGLGGRLDATNILHPQASVLTPIELEHTEILGDTIEKIAIEKSKIIKLNTPSFMSYQKTEAKNVFEKEAKEKNSELTKIEDEIKALETEETPDFQKLHIEFKDGYSANLRLAMIGNVQAYNCALALCVLRKLGLYKKGITEPALEKNTIPGRMEKLSWDRPIYIDGAHTENSMKYLVDSFKTIYKENDSVCIFGCLEGKNVEAMGHIILENFNTVIICKPGNYKKSNSQKTFELFNELKHDNQTIYLIEDANEALKFCLKNTKVNTPILVCGSFYLVGAIKEIICH